ncbi:MAG: hypothetical protein COV44_11800 [Deltaproteobacteria bacterium CG11_big_fil_rev_8_21_14_0_20_45_16]|nr:MAG: hypothetical protein COV44_11800 [Deltaproteobacteria bacterium CG11_big_fil_rev_8_21_14_0_20_45_16]
MRVSGELFGFSFMEIMVAGLVSAFLMVGTLKIMSTLNSKAKVAEVSADLALRASQVNVLLSQDIDKAVFFSGGTVAGTHFEGTPTFGISRFPFQDINSDTSDGIKLFVLNSGASLQSSNRVTALAINAGKSTITVEGDFTPVKAMDEDLFLMRCGDSYELFTVESSIVYTPGTPGSSQFVATEDGTDFLTYINNPLTYGLPEIVRVSRKIYQIGHGVATSGLFAYENGLYRLIDRNIQSMQIKFQLRSRDEQAVSDCAAKNDSRYFVNGSVDTECDWNDIVGLKWEMIFVSSKDVDGAESENSHTGVVDSKVKFLSVLSKSPYYYTAELTN